MLQEPLYYKAGALVRHLIEWRGSSDTIAGRLEELMVDLYERELVERKDVEVTRQWLLWTRLGTSFPTWSMQFRHHAVLQYACLATCEQLTQPYSRYIH